MMTLREMIIERIKEKCDDMRNSYQMECDLDDDLEDLDDADLFGLYEDVYGLA